MILDARDTTAIISVSSNDDEEKDMAYPSKQAMIYQRVSTDLEQCAPGARLPSERNYARQLGISRKALRVTLDRLTVENRIRRTPQGTFVLSLDRTDEPGPVTLLLPCPNYLDSEICTSGYIHQQALLGAMRAAVARGTRAVTIPVSETNDPENINLLQLRSLQTNSIVLCFGHWFLQTMEILIRRNCRLGAVFENCGWIPDPPPQRSIIYHTEGILTDPVAEAARKLIADGAGNILYFGVESAWLSRRGKTKFLQELQQHGLDSREERFVCFPSGWSRMEIFRELRRLYSKFRFDALIMEIQPRSTGDDSGPDFYEETGLPASVRIVSGICNLLRQRLFAGRAQVMYLPYMRLFRDMTEYLLDRPGETVIRKTGFVIQPAAQFITETNFT